MNMVICIMECCQGHSWFQDDIIYKNEGTAESTKQPSSVIGRPGTLLKEWVHKTPI